MPAPAPISSLASTLRDHLTLATARADQVARRAKESVSNLHQVLDSAEGTVAQLAYPLDHFPFSKGIAKWVEKHNLYSKMEAELIVRNQGLQNPSLLTALRDPDFHTRRLHQKAIFYRLPGRPLLKWLYMVFLRGAILDGAAGLAYATLQAFYEYLIVLKTKELRRGGA